MPNGNLFLLKWGVGGLEIEFRASCMVLSPQTEILFHSFNPDSQIHKAASYGKFRLRTWRKRSPLSCVAQVGHRGLTLAFPCSTPTSHLAGIPTAATSPWLSLCCPSPAHSCFFPGLLPRLSWPPAVFLPCYPPPQLLE